MNTHQRVEYDERTLAVGKVAGQWAHAFLLVGLLIDVMYRSVARNETAWDLMALMFMGSAISIIYQARRKALPGRSTIRVVLIACVVAGAIAFATAFVMEAMK